MLIGTGQSLKGIPESDFIDLARRRHRDRLRTVASDPGELLAESGQLHGMCGRGLRTAALALGILHPQDQLACQQTLAVIAKAPGLAAIRAAVISTP